MRGKLITIILVAAVVPSWGCSSCSKHGQVGDADADVGPDLSLEPEVADDPAIDAEDVPVDPDVDPEEELDASTEPDVEDESEDTFELPDVPFCGNFVVDPGEDCDDGNRLNGDGCDWLCRFGDGPPPGLPTPGACLYRSVHGPVYIDDSYHVARTFKRMPFTWSGSEFATVVWQDDPPTIRFRRFDASGRKHGTDHVMTFSGLDSMYDFVWTGSSYGLFYTDKTQGIMFESLAPDGTTVSGPTLVEADVYAGMPAADNHDGGFVLVWMAEGPELGAWNMCNEPINRAVKIRLLGPDGSTTGYPGPVKFWNTGQGPPDVAAGEHGFGVVFNDHVEPNWCYYRFLHVSSDFSTVTESGYLGIGRGWDVDWTGDGYFTSWACGRSISESGICFASFNADGILSRPPVYQALIDQVPIPGGPQLAPHCRGVSTVYPWEEYGAPGPTGHTLMRTDFQGREVASPDEINCCSFSLGGFNLTPVDSDTLAVLIAIMDRSTMERFLTLYIFSTTP